VPAPAPSPNPSPVPKPVPLTSVAKSKEILKSLEKSTGLVAWRQGELRGKDIWHVLKYPYETEEDFVTLVGVQPPGAKIATGPASAYITAARLFGKAPSRTVKLDMGIQDISISPRAKIVFTPDPQQLTKGDITIGSSKGKVFPLEKSK